VAALALITLFHPNDTLVWAPGIAVVALVAFGVWRHRQIATPKSLLQPAEGPAAPSGDLSKLAVEARRDIG
jgi:hypothetical protein